MIHQKPFITNANENEVSSSPPEPESSSSLHGTQMLQCVRNEFIRTVGQTINRVMAENGYSRDRATDLIVREFGDISGDCQEDELNHVKLHYHLTHQQATKALAISRAVKKLVEEGDKRTHLDAVRCLTEKLSNATFAHEDPVEPFINTSPTDSETHTTTSKTSEIQIPDVSKQQAFAAPPDRRPRSPTRRTKISLSSKTVKTKNSSSSLSSTKPNRKRSLEDIASVGTPQAPGPNGTVEQQQRHRSDSVTEAVTVKMQQNDPTIVNVEKSNPRKRRSSGSLDECDSGTVGKRSRSTTT